MSFKKPEVWQLTCQTSEMAGHACVKHFEMHVNNVTGMNLEAGQGIN